MDEKEYTKPEEVSMEEFLENMSKAMNKETTDGRGDDEEDENKEE